MNIAVKIGSTIGYIFFMIIEIVALIRGSYHNSKKVRSPEEFMRDSSINFSINQALGIWIVWQTVVQICLIWNM